MLRSLYIEATVAQGSSSSSTIKTKEHSGKKILILGSMSLLRHHHHQPINVPTAGAQAFFMDST
jgi:hypothetical protein